MIILSLITALSFLVYCPVLCYLDWKYRDIKTHAIWVPLLVLNIPVLVFGYATGIYSWVLALVSIFGIALWTALFLGLLLWLDKRPSADFVWLCLITIFMVLNPFTGQPFMQMFTFYLVGMTAATYWAIFLDNLILNHVLSLKMKNGIPYLIPISCALVLALVVS